MGQQNTSQPIALDEVKSRSAKHFSTHNYGKGERRESEHFSTRLSREKEEGPLNTSQPISTEKGKSGASETRLNPPYQHY